MCSLSDFLSWSGSLNAKDSSALGKYQNGWKGGQARRSGQAGPPGAAPMMEFALRLWLSQLGQRDPPQVSCGCPAVVQSETPEGQFKGLVIRVVDRPQEVSSPSMDTQGSRWGQGRGESEFY